jgi:hypothetical protein
VRARINLLVRRPERRDVAFGRSRRVTVSRGRARAVRLPLGASGRRALADCSAGRLVIVVRARGFARARRSTVPVRRDPPDCARFFGANAFWNTPLPNDAPLDPNSAPITEQLLRQVQIGFRAGPRPTINTTSYTPPIYTVGPDQPRQRVHLARPPGYAPELEAAWQSVPLPSGARAADGSDSELVVWQPSTDTMWEFWQLRRRRNRWEASWGGRMDRVSQSNGAYGPPNENWGTTASSLALVGGLILPSELRRGQIDHALAVAIPRARAGEYALPARRTDGDSRCPHAVPEGARFRLDPAVDVNALGLSPPIRAMARAAQRYGIVIRDQSAAVAFYAQNPLPFGFDPYPVLFGGQAPWDLLSSFPWQHLQLTRMQLARMPGGDPLLPPILSGCS